MNLEKLTKEQLIELIGIYAKNMLAMDGVWFQSVERTYGMDAAMYHDVEAWKRFTVTEARRIKKFLHLPERSGLEGLQEALKYRYTEYANPRTDSVLSDGKLIYRVVDCSAQTGRSKKGMEWHPCLPAGRVEYELFAQTIDERIKCRVLSCYPEITDKTCACSWEFTIEKED